MHHFQLKFVSIYRKEVKIIAITYFLATLPIYATGIAITRHLVMYRPGTSCIRFALTHERPTQHICCKKYTCTLPYTYLIKLYNMFVSVFYTYNLTYIQKKKLLFNIISLSRMTEHISKSELFCNKRNSVKSSTLHQNITILEMSCKYKKNMRI